MNIVTRYSHQIRITDYTTAGIAARLLGINHITFKTKVLRGEIPSYPSGTDRTDKIYRVRDIVDYAIRNEFPLDKDRIEGYSSFYQPSGIADKVYCYCVSDFDSVKNDPRFIKCNLRQFIDFLDTDPFNWFVIGNAKGQNYQNTFRDELDDILKPLTKDQKPFAYKFFTINETFAITDMFSWLDNQKGKGLRK